MDITIVNMISSLVVDKTYRFKNVISGCVFAEMLL